MAVDGVSRHMAEAAPAAVFYDLTEKGRDLAGVLDEFEAWARRWGEEAPAGPTPRLHDE
jgi:DNA-binding HxlR family transcriptional regulator